MLIRKEFKFEGAHIVRNCSSERCAFSIHGHSYRLELFVTADRLDHGQMILDFSLLKRAVGPFIDSFDHTMLYWLSDEAEYIDAVKKWSDRSIGLPFSPSAEMLSLFFLKAADTFIRNLPLSNGEQGVRISAARLHETATGYAESGREDLVNPALPQINLTEVVISEAVKNDWPADWADLHLPHSLKTDNYLSTAPIAGQEAGVEYE